MKIKHLTGKTSINIYGDKLLNITFKQNFI